MNTEGIKNNTINSTGITQEQRPIADDNMLFNALSAKNEPDAKIGDENFDNSEMDGMTIDEMFDKISEGLPDNPEDEAVSENEAVSGKADVSVDAPKSEKTEFEIRLMRLEGPAQTAQTARTAQARAMTPMQLQQFEKQTLLFANYLVKIAQAINARLYTPNAAQWIQFTNCMQPLNFNLAVISKYYGYNNTYVPQQGGTPPHATPRSLNNVMIWFMNIINGIATPQEVTPQGLFQAHLS